ncbi:DUF1684 domain-containing protein [Phaeovulum sp.]|uniref:DUF1684 domain-containing protein n=1 Tax=Phaeovulum sp. TaxID=2934796 RepID=UPI003562DEC4
MPTDPEFLAALDAWRARRLADLAADDGWLNLTDRLPIQPGAQSVGSGAGADLRLSVGPERLGELRLADDGTVTLTPEGAGPLAFVATPEAPPRLLLGRLLLEIHSVEGEPALRVRDLDSPARAKFGGLRYFPPAPEWRIRARWQPLPAPETRGITLKDGHAAQVQLTHRAEFEHMGRTVALLPTHQKAGKPMFVFRDSTARDRTYAACRFLIPDEIGDDWIVLDFNRAFSPPCAFSEHAICPLPPPENVLPFAIEAGELRP